MEATLVSMLEYPGAPQEDLRTGWRDVLSDVYPTEDVRGAKVMRIGHVPECLPSYCPPS